MRVADGDQPIDRSERQPVDELLDKIIHERRVPRDERLHLPPPERGLLSDRYPVYAEFGRATSATLSSARKASSLVPT